MIHENDGPKIEMNGRTVPEERRSEVRIVKDGTDENQFARAVTFKIATDQNEIEDAFSLVWENYITAGFQADDHVGVRFTKYHLLPETKIFIANFHQSLADGKPEQIKKSESKVVGTLSLIFDSDMGLPLEALCGDEVAELRAQGKKLAEVIGFAVDPKYAKYKTFLHMFKIMFQYAKMKGVTDLCCSVSERHRRFYRRVILFEPLGELVPYSNACDELAQGHILNVDLADKKSKQFYAGKEFDADLHRFFFTDSFSREKGEGKPLSEELLQYFVTERTNFIDTLTEKDLSILRAEYSQKGLHFPF